MSMKNKSLIPICIILIITMLISSACVANVSTEESMLQDISYKYYKNEDEYTVMIKEQGEYVPYLVITDDYDDSETCLLLRKYLLDEYMRYGESDQFNPSYYGRSELGEYIETEFIKRFSQDMQGIILESNVEISTYDSITDLDEETEYINRKIFLLSYYEMGYEYNRTKNLEGKPLEYFNSTERRIAYEEDGEKGEWWLRTPELRSNSVVMGVTMNGEGAGCGISGGSFDYELGVRPAFCLPRDTSIIEVDGLYYIEADYNSLDVMNNADDRRSLLYEDILTPRQTNNAKPISNEYHKEEYNEFIRAGLTQELDAHKEEKDYLYHVAFYSVYEIDLDEILFEINNDKTDVYLNKEYWTSVENPYYDETYYYVLTIDEILALSEYKISLAYVGSGNCDMEKANWDTTEGILEYCELYGDGYVAK